MLGLEAMLSPHFTQVLQKTQRAFVRAVRGVWTQFYLTLSQNNFFVSVVFEVEWACKVFLVLDGFIDKMSSLKNYAVRDFSWSWLVCGLGHSNPHLYRNLTFF